jgi:DNA modification methylase
MVMNMMLIHGDCCAVMQQLLNDNVHVDHVITDPPYVIDYADWDKSFDMKQAVHLAAQLLRRTTTGNLLLFQGWSNVAATKLLLDAEPGLVCRNWIIYDRVKGRGATYNLVSTREDILWYAVSDKSTFTKTCSNVPKKTKGMGERNGLANRVLSNVWSDISPLVPWSKERSGHPTQKPLQLMERLLTVFTNPGDVVLDFCMGSGSTGVACAKLGRDFIGVERDEHWFTVAKQRLTK